jgi:hypothetical protein
VRAGRLGAVYVEKSTGRGCSFQASARGGRDASAWPDDNKHPRTWAAALDWELMKKRMEPQDSPALGQ